MNIYEYDICDFSKGIIIANNLERATKLLQELYPKYKFDTEHYWPEEINEDCDYGVHIDNVTELDGTEKIIETILG